ncbi:MAG: hypothetical protein ACK58J_11840 [Planctomyces sp.]
MQAMRLTAVLAVVFSAVFARPLHELEHSGTAVSSATDRPTCSCSHLHGHGHSSSLPNPMSDGDSGRQPEQRQPDGSHSHNSCSICLAFWLQSPFGPVQHFAADLIVERLADAELTSQCGVQALCLPPLRGPPAA